MAVYAGPNNTEGNLIFYYDISNSRSYPGTGTAWFDLSGNNHTASFINNTGLCGGNLYFDGTDDYVNIGTNTAYNGVTSNFSVDIWWSTTDELRNLNYLISNARDCCGTYNGFEIIGYQGAFPRFLINLWNGTAKQMISNARVFSNRWYNVVLTQDTSTARLYVNGLFDNSIGNTGIGAPGSDTLRLGAMGLFPSFEMIGFLNVAKMYNRALTASEVLDNYNSIRGRFGL
jgi:hypothetical protein